MLVLTRKIGGEIPLASGDVLQLREVNSECAVLQLNGDVEVRITMGEARQVPGGTITFVDVLPRDRARLGIDPVDAMQRPEALVTRAERMEIGRRPPIVWTYAALQVALFASGIAVDIQRHSSIGDFSTIFDALMTAVFIWIIWTPSRFAWGLSLALYVLFLPFGYSFVDLRPTGVALFALEVASIAVLLTPWMIRWAWRKRTAVSEDVKDLDGSA